VFSLRALVIIISVILDIVIVEVTVIVCVTRDVARDNLIEVSGAVTKIRRGRGWSGRLDRGQRDGDDRGS